MPDLRRRNEFEKAIAKAFQRQGARFVDELIGALGDPPKMNNIPEWFWRRYGAELRQAIQPTLEAIYLESARQVLGEAPFALSWSLPNEAAARWAERYSFDLVTQIDQTTVRRLETYVADYFRTTTTMGQLQAQIKPNIADLQTKTRGLLTSTRRAQLIAITEVTRASVRGELDVVAKIEADGIRMTAIWNTNNDDLVCPLCGPRNQQAEGDGWTEPPPAHPGCRCWLNHSVAEPAVFYG